MIPVSFIWDTRERSIYVRWDGFFSLGWKNGRVLKKVLGIPIPFKPTPPKIRSPRMRWVYVKELPSFLRKWRLKKVEGTFSFPDPMVNGVLYGGLSAIGLGKVCQKIDLTINFTGENWCAGEATISPKVLFHDLRRWGLPLLRQRRRETERRR